MLKTSNGHEYFNAVFLTKNLKTQALKGAGATIFTQIFSYGIQTIGIIILARLLTPDDFGLIAMVTVFTLLLQNFGINGFTEAVIQKKEINQQQLSTLFWINTSISLSLTLILIALSTLIAAFYIEPRLRSIINVLSFTVIMSSVSTHHMALLKRNMHFYRTSAIDMVAVIFSISAAITLAYMGWGYWSLVVRQLFVPMITAIGAWILCRWRPGLPTFDSGTKPMVKFALNVYGNFCLTYFRKNFDRVLIGRFLGSQPLGHYDRAHQLSSMLPNQLTIPLSDVALATLSRLANDSEQYRNYLSMMFSGLAFVVLPVSVILSLIGKDIIYLLLGPKWLQAGEIFSILGLGIGMIVLYNTHGWIHLSLGRADRWFRWSIIALVTTIIFFLIGLPFGLLGLASANTFSIYVLILPAIWYAGKPGGIKLSIFISAVWKYFCAAIVAGLLSYFSMYIFDFSSAFFHKLSILARIFIASGFYCCTYLILVVALFKSTKPIIQFMIIFRDMIPKIK